MEHESDGDTNGKSCTWNKGLIKGLEYQEIRKQEETIQTTSLLRLARILRKVLTTWGDLLSLKLQWEPIS